MSSSFRLGFRTMKWNFIRSPNLVEFRWLDGVGLSQIRHSNGFLCVKYVVRFIFFFRVQFHNLTTAFPSRLLSYASAKTYARTWSPNRAKLNGLDSHVSQGVDDIYIYESCQSYTGYQVDTIETRRIRWCPRIRGGRIVNFKY